MAIMTVISTLIHSPMTSAFVASVQILTLILCFRFLYRYNWLEAVIIISLTYSLITVSEFIVMYSHSLLINVPAIDKFVNNDFALNIYIQVLLMLTILILQAFRVGFTFINLNHRRKRSSNLTRIAFIGSLLNILILSLASVSIFHDLPMIGVNVSFSAIIFLLALLIQLYYRRELSEI